MESFICVKSITEINVITSLRGNTYVAGAPRRSGSVLVQSGHCRTTAGWQDETFIAADGTSLPAGKEAGRLRFHV